MKRLMVVLASVLVLGGCASYIPVTEPIKTNNVVLDWKDFKPITHGSGSECNTVTKNHSLVHQYKMLCFIESSTHDDIHHILFSEREYKDQLSEEPITHIAHFVNDICINKPEKIGFNTRVCEVQDLFRKRNMFFVFRDLRKDNYNYAFVLVSREIPLGETIDKDSADYKTALNIANDSLKKL